MSTDSTSSAAALRPDEVERTSLLYPLEGIYPHNEFWFPDGNLILVARDVAFRVYRCLLSYQSTVFADIFAVACVDADERFEGCPIVRLTDSPQDLTHLLRILFPRSQRRLYPRQNEPKLSFDKVSALARLSHKYGIQDVEDQALDLLRRLYPDEESKWCGLVATSPRVPISISPLQCIGAVNIARLTNTLSLLPTALYSCCALGPSLLDGWTREDGTVEALSPDDLKRCFAARERLWTESVKMVAQVFDGEPSNSCFTPDRCRPALKDMALSLVREGLPLSIRSDALRGFEDDIPRLKKTLPICVFCGWKLWERDSRARRELWSRLPEIFEILIPSWGENPSRVAA